MTYDSYRLVLEKLESSGCWFLHHDQIPDGKVGWVVPSTPKEPKSFAKLKSSLLKLGVLNHEIELAPAHHCSYPNSFLIYISLPDKRS
ncbi:hypothetical protein GO755_20815 [Spirosoma sp. HMF4905]|uniref:Uncharacterized protein n=1 Tax=Spirosoma arboris TaxID=2682092 RepID=A0A7K1SG05_9BACT|nr:hypothetical protein [Spirosoma arboris]MVM32496.1 hypothetical protein [Spirosoma arboris]